MAWSIEVNLPESRDYKGTLKMYANGVVVFSCECLGRGSDCTDHTQWWITNGDTPTGSYNGTLIGVGDPATSGTWYPLRPTHGCIRVSNTNQQKIADLVKQYGSGTGVVSVYGIQKEMA